MAKKCIVLAGGTGDLGHRIAKALLSKGADVRILTRSGGSSDRLGSLIESGAKAMRVDYSNSTDLAKACEGAACVVSALSGLREVIVDGEESGYQLRKKHRRSHHKIDRIIAKMINIIAAIDFFQGVSAAAFLYKM